MCIKMHLFKKKIYIYIALRLGYFYLLWLWTTGSWVHLQQLKAAWRMLAWLTSFAWLTLCTHIYMCARAFSLLAVFHLLCPNVCFCMDAVPAALPPAAKSKPGTNWIFLHFFPSGCSAVKSAAHPSHQGASAAFTRHFKINTLITGYFSMRNNGRHHSVVLTQQSATLGEAA